MKIKMNAERYHFHFRVSEKNNFLKLSFCDQNHIIFFFFFFLLLKKKKTKINKRKKNTIIVKIL